MFTFYSTLFLQAEDVWFKGAVTHCFRLRLSVSIRTVHSLLALALVTQPTAVTTPHSEEVRTQVQRQSKISGACCSKSTKAGDTVTTLKVPRSGERHEQHQKQVQVWAERWLQ
jgi:hypothetical protein